MLNSKLQDRSAGNDSDQGVLNLVSTPVANICVYIIIFPGIGGFVNICSIYLLIYDMRRC